MKALFDAEQVKAIERACLALTGPGVLMQRAAKAVADEVERNSFALPAPVTILGLCGPGNNGEDARLALELLQSRGFATDSVGLDSLQQAFVETARRDAFLARLTPSTIVIDGLFGIGLNRALPPWLSQFFAFINQRPHRLVAIDLPSGLDCNTGTLQGGCLRADVTLTMLVDKLGLHTGQAVAYTGVIKLCQLDSSLNEIKLTSSKSDLLDLDWVLEHLRVRALLAHKGTHGAVLVVGGSAGMFGAALLAAQGAQTLGAGKVFVHLLGASPEAYQSLSIQYPSLLAYADLSDLEKSLSVIDCVVIGCGLGQSDFALSLLSNICATCRGQNIPMVVDADALNLLAKHPDQVRLGVRDVMTPHPLEAARLLASEIRQVESNRFVAGAQLSQLYGCVSLLKGPGSIISQTAQGTNASANGQGFTHQVGDVVTVSTARLGSLVNRVNTCDQIPPWTYGITALMHDLARRGLLA